MGRTSQLQVFNETTVEKSPIYTYFKQILFCFLLKKYCAATFAKEI